MIALVLAAVVVVGALAVWKLFPKDDTSRVSVNEAVAQFREEGGGSGSGEGVLFERQPGVYRYETKGSESARHRPAQHHPRLRRHLDDDDQPDHGCGVVERWQVLGGRWAEFTSCPTKGGDFFELIGFVEYHEFFGETARIDLHLHRRPGIEALGPPGREDIPRALPLRRRRLRDQRDPWSRRSRRSMSAASRSRRPHHGRRQARRPRRRHRQARRLEKAIRRVAAAAGDEQRREAERHDRRRLPRELLAAAALGQPAPVAQRSVEDALARAPDPGALRGPARGGRSGRSEPASQGRSGSPLRLCPRIRAASPTASPMPQEPLPAPAASGSDSTRSETRAKCVRRCRD